MTLPDLKGTATLDNAPFRKSVSEMQGDLRALQTIAKSAGTIRITADLSAAQRDVQRGARAVRDAVQDAIPTDMQRRIDGLFGGFNTGAASAKASASVFAAQASALRERINELDRAVKITRADFQSGFGEATPEEIGKLTSEMARLQRELKDVGDQAVSSFGKYSAEAQKVANANRLAQATAAAARGEISRLGLASQVKLGTSAALQQYGPQAGLAANGLFQFAAASDRARIAQGLFQKTIQKTGQTTDEAAQVLAKLQDNLGVSAEVATDGVRALLRQGYTLKQAYTALEGAGASALAAGKSAATGMQAYTDAVIAGDSARLTEAGISENLSTFYQREAKARNTTVDGLTRQQKVQAELNLVTAATADEVGDLSALMGGLGGNTSSANRELTEASRALGEKLVPLATNGARALTRILEIFTSLPEPIQATVALLGASAVAVGVLAGPVSALAQGYSQIRDGLKGIRGASSALGGAAAATAEAGSSALDTAGGLAQSGDAFTSLAEKAKGFYGVMATKLSTYLSGVLLATGATNIFQASALKLIGTNLLGFLTAGAAGAVALAAGVGAAAVGLGVASVTIIKQTQAVYDQADAANDEAFKRTMERVTALTKEGTELFRAQAKVLLAQQKLGAAEAGTIVGVKWTGERIIERDEEAIKRYRAELVAAQGNVVSLYTEAQRRGTLNLKLTQDQTKAVKELRSTLEGRAFDLKVSGLTEMDADLARIGRDMDALRVKFKQPFIVQGKLMDPKQTPALRTGLAEIDAQALAEQAAVRKKYADQAADAAKKSALDVQAAEVAALKGGAQKRAAERRLEVESIERTAKEEAEKYKDFPKQREQIESDARKIIAAKRRGWAEEDRDRDRQTAQRVADAEASAQAGVVAAMEEGHAKREAARALDLENLKRNIAQRVKELAGDPEAQAKVQADGQTEIDSKIRQQGRERAQEEKDAAAQVADIRRAARDAEAAAIADEDQRRAVQRKNELADIEEANQKRVDGLKGYAQKQADALAAGQKLIEGKKKQYAEEDKRLAKEAAQRIVDASLRAQDAQFTAQKAGRDNQAAAFELDLARRLAGVKDNALKTAQIEAEAVDARAKLAEKSAKAQYDADAKRLENDRDRALGNDKLSKGEREDIWRAYYGNLNTLSGNFQAAEKIRLQKQEDDARAAAERIRLARVAAAVKPADAAARDVLGLQAQEQLAETAAARLAIERQIQVAQQTQADTYRAALADAKTLGLTDQERIDLAEKLRTSENAVAQSRRAQLDLSKQIADDRLRVSQGRTQELSASRELARTDAGRLQIDRQIAQERETQLAELRGQLLGLGGVILTAQQRLEVEAQIRGIQRDQRSALLDQQDAARALRDSALDRLDAEAQYAERIARTDAERVAAQQRQLEAYQGRLRDLDTQIAGEGRAQERNTLLNQRLDLLGKIRDVQEQIDTAPLAVSQRQTAGLQAQRAYALELAGLSEDAVARAQEGVRAAEAEVALAEQALGYARTQAGREAAQTDLTGKRTALLTAERALGQARNEQDGKALDLAEARARAELQLRGLADDAVASAQLDLDVTRERLALLERQQRQGTAGDGAEGRRVALLGQQAEQERKLAQAQRDRETVLRGLADAQAELGRELEGSARRATPLQGALGAIATARIALARAEQEYQRAVAQGAPEQRTAATLALTSAIKGQRDAVAGLATVYRAQVENMNGVRDAAERLRQIAYGGDGPFNSQTERARLEAIQTRRDAAQRALAAALNSGDVARIQAATQDLTQQEERYRKQADLLEKNGVKFTRTGAAQTQRLADQVDALGIQYDREAVLLTQRADIVDQEAATAQVIRGAADDFGEYGAALAEQIRQVNTGRVQLETPAPTTPDAARILAAQLLQSLRTVSAQAPVIVAPAVAATAPVTNISNVTDVGGLTIYQQPGENAEALADRVIGKLEDRARRSGRRC